MRLHYWLWIWSKKVPLYVYMFGQTAFSFFPRFSTKTGSWQGQWCTSLSFPTCKSSLEKNYQKNVVQTRPCSYDSPGLWPLEPHIHTLNLLRSKERQLICVVSYSNMTPQWPHWETDQNNWDTMVLLAHAEEANPIKVGKLSRVLVEKEKWTLNSETNLWVLWFVTTVDQLYWCNLQ